LLGGRSSGVLAEIRPKEVREGRVSSFFQITRA